MGEPRLTIEHTKKRSVLLGRSISPGVGRGVAVVDEPVIVPMKFGLGPEEIAAQIAELDRARALLADHLVEHVKAFHAPADEDLGQVVAAHLNIVEDQGFFGDIEERILQDRLPADQAVMKAFSAAAARLAASRDSYMRARAEDLRDVCQSIRRALAFGADAFRHQHAGDEPVVMVAPHLHPSAVIRARRLNAVGFVTGSTAFTSHAAILLRAAGIPTVAGVVSGATAIRTGTPLLVNADRGEVVVHPGADEVSAVEAVIEASEAGPTLPPLDAVLPDGGAVTLLANIDHPSQARQCLRHRLRGVGLFRSELIVAERGAIPSEEEQLAVYRELVEAVQHRPVVIRTFDFGADKEPSGLSECIGSNPALGLRGLRRHLHRRPEELRTQLRAIMRAAVGADVSVLLPMVTHAGDVRAARVEVDRVARELESDGLPFGKVEVGAMIEVPAAALRVRDVLAVSDFLSVGTNDLVQYLAAADRENSAVLDYQQVEQSGIYELLELVMNTSRSMNRAADLTVCGELASDPDGARRLTQLGFRSLSIGPSAADRVRRAIGEGHRIPRPSYG